MSLIFILSSVGGL